MSKAVSANKPPPQSPRSLVFLARIVGLALFLFGAATLGYYGRAYLQFELGTPAERLQILWEQDLNLLRKAGTLPPEFSRIKEIEFSPATDVARAWAKTLKTPIRLKGDGTHKLEILLLSWEEGQSLGAIIQYDLIDIRSNNTIWELGRTFTLTH